MTIEISEASLYLLAMAVSLLLLAAALGLYVLITPYRELRLIGQSNRAAAVALGGTAIGLALVINGVTQGRFDIIDLIRWAGIGLAFQLLVPIIVALLVPGLRAGINADRLGYGVLLACLSIAMGLVNAGALTKL